MKQGKGEVGVNIELSKDDLSLLEILLSKEINETRVEIHHSRRDVEIKAYLKRRENAVNDLLTRIKNTMDSNPPDREEMISL